jgi:AAA+ superfamily predicted ATPase
MQPTLTPDLTYLRAHLVRIDFLLSFAVERAQAIGFEFNNEFQGLYISDEEIERHLSLSPGAGIWDGAPIDPENRALFDRRYADWLKNIQNFEKEAQNKNYSLRIKYLLQALKLVPEDLDLLLVCLAPAIERRYERLYSFLQDDVTRRQPSVNFALNLIGQDWQHRVNLMKRLTEDAPLIREGVIIPYTDTGNPNTAFNNYLLRVDPRIVNYLQGIDHVPASLETSVRFVPVEHENLNSLVLAEETRQRLRSGYPKRYGNNLPPIFHFYGGYGSGKRTIAATLAHEFQDGLLEINLHALKQGSTIPHDIPIKQFRLALREGILRKSALLLSRWESILDDNYSPPMWLWDAIVNYPYVVFLSGHKEWEPHGTFRQRPVLRLHLEVPEFKNRLRHWQVNLTETAPDPAELAYKFQLTGGQIRDAVYTALDLAAWRGEGQPTLADLYAGSRAQSNRRLSNLAQKITPRYTWERLILPDDRIQQLREISNQVKFAVKVYDDWNFGGNIANAYGVTALFAGQSGTGKTMAAEVIASDLGIELYKIDLSTVVSKYIGETEKNLAAIFEEATQSNAILFFDEADALFGKRSEVKDSHDRYANIEVGYLLQRMETYDGVAILATNLRQNLDEAFTRRLDFLIDFPFPEEEDRLRIWQVSFPKSAPLADDVDLQEIASRYRIAGGNIRNAVIAAAFLAAAESEPCIHMNHVQLAIRREYQKMGKLVED